MTADNSHFELDWLAFRYLADELDAAERDRFELQLAEDQQAREALARAVELTQAVAAVGATLVGDNSYASVSAGQAMAGIVSTRRSSNVWLRRLAWMAAGAAASAAMVLLYHNGSSVDAPGQQVAQHAEEPAAKQQAWDRSTGELALAWSQARDEFAEREPNQWSLGLVSDDPTVGDQEPAPVSETFLHTSEPSLAAPDWMLAAVSGVMDEDDETEVEQH